MTQRTRKFAGTVALIVMIAVYALIATVVAAYLEVHTTSKVVEFLFYMIAGLAWTLPAGWLIWWMAQPDPPKAGKR